MTFLSRVTHCGLLFEASVELFFLLLQLVAELLLGPLLLLLQETQLPELLSPGEIGRWWQREKKIMVIVCLF